MKKRVITILVVGIILIIISPFLLTRPAFWDILVFSNTGPIGDTIGGITAPITSLLGSYLVYLALRAQIDANSIIQTQLAQDRARNEIQYHTEEINSLYCYLKDSIDNFDFSTLDSSAFGKDSYTRGSEAIYLMLQQVYCDDYCTTDKLELTRNPKITEFHSILIICNKLMEKINSSTIPTKNVMKTLVCHQFSYRIMPFLNDISEEELRGDFCRDCKKNHGLPDEIVNLINNIKTCMD